MSEEFDQLNRGYSPDISAQLEIAGEFFTLASLGPEQLVLRDARAMPKGSGIIRMMIDKQAMTYHVEMSEGIDPARRQQAYRVVEVVGAVA